MSSKGFGCALNTYSLAVLQPFLVVVNLNVTEFPAHDVRACCGNDFLFDDARSRVRTVIEASRREVDFFNIKLFQVVLRYA